MEKHNLQLTPMETQVMEAFISDLYAEPGFSDVSPQDLQRMTKIPMTSFKGVIGSLTKKGLIHIADGRDMGIEFDIVYLSSDYYYLHPEWKNEQ
jgi:hypothetical protein